MFLYFENKEINGKHSTQQLGFKRVKLIFWGVIDNKFLND